MGTTVLGEGCGLVSFIYGECGVLGWWKLGVLFVPRIGSVGHKWTPIPPKHKTPSLLFHSHGDGFGVRGARTWFTGCLSNPTCSCKS